MLAALPCERCCLRTLPAGSGLATCGPGIGHHGLVDLVAHGPGFTLLRPGLQIQLLLADVLGTGHGKQAA